MTPECCSCVSAERLRRPSGVSEQGLLGTWGCDHSHEALWTPGPAKHLHPGVCLCRLDQEGHGDGLERETNWPPTGTNSYERESSLLLWLICLLFFGFFFLFAQPLSNAKQFSSTVRYALKCISVTITILQCKCFSFCGTNYYYDSLSYSGSKTAVMDFDIRCVF